MAEPERFLLEVIDLHWLKGADDPKDLCAHGRVRVVVGDDVLCGADSGDWTLSAAAVHLMRTISDDYAIGDFAGQLLPCCGFTMIPDAEHRSVVAIGCATGIDWSVQHSADKRTIKLTTEGGRVHNVDRAAYRDAIFFLADRVEAFYIASTPKLAPDDAEEREGYELLWKEWRRLRGRQG